MKHQDKLTQAQRDAQSAYIRAHSNLVRLENFGTEEQIHKAEHELERATENYYKFFPEERVK